MGVADAALGRHVVHEHDRGIAARKELLERQDLPSVAKRILRQKPHLRQAVEGDPPGGVLLDFPLDQADGAAKFDFPGMKYRLLAAFTQDLFGRGQLDEADRRKGRQL